MNAIVPTFPEMPMAHVVGKVSRKGVHKFRPVISSGMTIPSKTGPIVTNGTRLNRNAKCSCGSGKKFKNCHYAEYAGKSTAEVPAAAAPDLPDKKPIMTLEEIIEKARGGPAPPAPPRMFA